MDPELLALPVPFPARRIAAFSVMAFTAACALVLAAFVRRDVGFVFSPAAPIAAGEVLVAEVAALPTHRMLTLEGDPMMSKAVFYERALSGDAYVAFALAGQRDVWVQVPVRGDRAAALARRSFTGRLVPVSELGVRFSAVREYVSGTMGERMSPETRVLLADERPLDAWPALGQLLLALGIVLVDAALLLRWFRPLPLDESPGSETRGSFAG